MKHLGFVLIDLFIILATSVQAQVYQNGSHRESIRTLTVYPDGVWSALPILTLGSDQTVQISFDELSHDYKRYSYRIIHCNSDWTKSDMDPLEYLNGFPENEIETYEQSVSTFTLYTHYTFSLPNNQVQLKLSGNYAVEIFERDLPQTTLATACFMICENKTSIDATLSATTDIDRNSSHQQLSIEVKPIGLKIIQPLNEIKVTVQQNHRRDNEVKDLIPMQLGSGQLRYEHNPKLIFKGGNEYRRFEMTTYKYSGLNINKIAYFAPYYHVELLPSMPRTNQYLYDQDQNGRFLIHTIDGQEDLTGSEYFLVHFSIPMENPLIDGAFYLYGDFVDNQLNANTKMTYSFERKAYEKALLLKQGTYNYQYMYKPTNSNKPTTDKMEGSYWQTENEYQIFVYYRALGERYDRLIGFQQINTAF
jgi:hypothetical protein